MITDTMQVIVNECDYACHSIPMTRVHHREFPEVWGEGRTAFEGTHHLIHRLELYLEGAASHFRRDAIRQALADVRAFQTTVPAEATTCIFARES
jgi:hypothetical protein